MALPSLTPATRCECANSSISSQAQMQLAGCGPGPLAVQIGCPTQPPFNPPPTRMRQIEGCSPGQAAAGWAAELVCPESSAPPPCTQCRLYRMGTTPDAHMHSTQYKRLVPLRLHTACGSLCGAVDFPQLTALSAARPAHASNGRSESTTPRCPRICQCALCRRPAKQHPALAHRLRLPCLWH